MSSVDDEIAHLAFVMKLYLPQISDDRALPPAYWRHRLHEILNEHHLTKQQLATVHNLIDQLDRANRREKGRHR
jgi:hypothetical protein